MFHEELHLSVSRHIWGVQFTVFAALRMSLPRGREEILDSFEECLESPCFGWKYKVGEPPRVLFMHEIKGEFMSSFLALRPYDSFSYDERYIERGTERNHSFPWINVLLCCHCICV